MSVINTNVSAMYSQNAMKTNARVQSTAMEQLSTGVRVNSAKDDAAGLAIGQNMTSQIRGLNQAVRNLNDGINMVQTAEGAMVEQSNMLQRMRELAVQAMNGTYSDTQRSYLDKEFQALTQQINRISNDTMWNDQKLLAGGGYLKTKNAAPVLTPDAASQTTNATAGIVKDYAGRNVAPGMPYFATAAATTLATGTVVQFAEDEVPPGMSGFATNPLSAANKATLKAASDAITDAQLAAAKATMDGSPLVAATANALTAKTSAAAALATALALKDNTAAAAAAATPAVPALDTAAADALTAWNTATTANTNAIAAYSTAKGLSDAVVVPYETKKAIRDAYLDITNKVWIPADKLHAQFTVQAGKDQDQTITVDVVPMNAAGLGISGLAIDSFDHATQTLDQISTALETINNQRAGLGAAINQMAYAADNLTNVSSNATQSRSTIMDTDYALATTQLAKTQIIQQAATAMLAQANQQPQSVMALLKG
jgi:flagellin